MSYRQDNLKRLQNARLLSLVVVLGIIFYFFSGLILTGGFELLSSITLPIWRAENSIRDGLGGIFAAIKFKEALETDNRRLTEELSSANLRLQMIGSLEQENEQLMAQMGVMVPKKARAILGNVLSGPSTPPYESLIVDMGKDDGVSVGDRVLYEPNILLGEVSQVFSRSARVKLYSASGVNTDVLVPSSKDVWHAVAKGYGNGNFFIDLPSQIAVGLGTEILIPGSEMYVLGSVEHINIDPTTAEEQMLLRSPINIKNVRFVHIITEPVNEYLQ